MSIYATRIMQPVLWYAPHASRYRFHVHELTQRLYLQIPEDAYFYMVENEPNFPLGLHLLKNRMLIAGLG